MLMHRVSVMIVHVDNLVYWFTIYVEFQCLVIFEKFNLKKVLSMDLSIFVKVRSRYKKSDNPDF